MVPNAPASPARRLRRWLLWGAVLLALAVAAPALWHSHWAAGARMLWTLSRMPAATTLPVPVDGVKPRQIANTFGAARGHDREHAGVDIFARRGTPVRSATPGVIATVRDSGLGGRQVWVIGPARERYYYAHLEGWAENLAQGQVVQAGDLLGYVGDSGNAKGTPPHLHFGLYGPVGARDPLPLMR